MLLSSDVFTLLVVEKNGKKRLVVCGGGWVVFLWASRFRRASVFWVRCRDGCLLPPRFTPLRVGSRKPIFLADTMILLVDVSSLLLHLT
jgi:hypothetical protein